jgi:hypothetical protein
MRVRARLLLRRLPPGHRALCGPSPARCHSLLQRRMPRERQAPRFFRRGVSDRRTPISRLRSIEPNPRLFAAIPQHSYGHHAANCSENPAFLFVSADARQMLQTGQGDSRMIAKVFDRTLPKETLLWPRPITTRSAFALNAVWRTTLLTSPDSMITSPLIPSWSSTRKTCSFARGRVTGVSLPKNTCGLTADTK